MDAIEFIVNYATYLLEIKEEVMPELHFIINDLLEIDPHDLLSPDTFFSSETQARGYVWLLFIQKVINEVTKTIEQNVANTMCSIMGSKPSGLVFDYLNFEDFKNLKIMDKRELNEDQSYKLHRARCQYNSRLKRIATDLEIEKLTSHVSRHSFAYFMLSSGATVEEISHAMGHSSIEMTQNYLKQFPSKYSDNAIRKFEASFEI